LRISPKSPLRFWAIVGAGSIVRKFIRFVFIILRVLFVLASGICHPKVDDALRDDDVESFVFPNPRSGYHFLCRPVQHWE